MHAVGEHGPMALGTVHLFHRLRVRLAVAPKGSQREAEALNQGIETSGWFKIVPQNSAAVCSAAVVIST